ISIKARMLFPKPSETEEAEPEDPRRELVERLVEYLRYKEAGETLAVCHEQRADQYTRPVILNVEKESTPESYSNATLFHLISSLKRILAEAPEEPMHAVRRVDYTVEEQQAFLRVRLSQAGTSSFRKLVQGRSKQFIIATFLAVLELARSGEAAVHIDQAADDFSLEPLVLCEETTGQAA
ncbi:MAG TPA: segregation/condensation protein A, partial [Rhodothermales bacterium]|nr:segregation/condensation protein A [Rhodothermales bacterium]